MKKYKIAMIGLVMLLVLLIGCNKNQKEIQGQIRELIQLQEKLVNEKEINGYINTLSWENPEYVAEKKSWMRDIKNSKIEGYQLSIGNIKIIDEEKAYGEVHQKYDFRGKTYQVQYPLFFKKERGSWKDGDMKFDEMQTAHFRIKYFKKSEKYAKKVYQVCEEAYQNVSKRYGESPAEDITIKLYQDKEMLRQSVKLSFAWQFAGWYEYPESIKTTAFDSKRDYLEIIEHELIHQMTIKASKNNLPYWFAEGLAMYFTNYQNQPSEYSSKKYYLSTYEGNSLGILELEGLNLEKMEEEEEINQYYDTSGMIVKFMVERYGLDNVKEIVKYLGTYDHLEGTGEEVDGVSVQRFHDVLPKILGLSVEELDKEWIAYLKS